MAEIKRLVDYILLSSGIILFINLIPEVKNKIQNGSVDAVAAVAGIILVLGVLLYLGLTVILRHFRDVVFTVEQTNIYINPDDDEEERGDYE